MSKKEKVEIYIDPSLKLKLKAHAESVGGSMAGVIKVLLKNFLK